MTKICKKCQLPKAEFFTARRKKDGFHSWCKECHLSIARERRKTKREGG